MRHIRRHKRFYRRSPVSGAVQSAVWMIGLGVLFLTGWWWPGIMIVIGASMIAGALVRGGETWLEPEAEPWSPPAPPPPSPPPSPFNPQPEAPVAPAPVFRAEPPARRVRLPDICPNCGAPPRSLSQRGENPGECPYCGSEIGSLEA